MGIDGDGCSWMWMDVRRSNTVTNKTSKPSQNTDIPCDMSAGRGGSKELSSRGSRETQKCPSLPSSPPGGGGLLFPSLCPVSPPFPLWHPSTQSYTSGSALNRANNAFIFIFYERAGGLTRPY